MTVPAFTSMSSFNRSYIALFVATLMTGAMGQPVGEPRHVDSRSGLL
jgi:hypothetical protein